MQAGESCLLSFSQISKTAWYYKQIKYVVAFNPVGLHLVVKLMAGVLRRCVYGLTVESVSYRTSVIVLDLNWHRDQKYTKLFGLVAQKVFTGKVEFELNMRTYVSSHNGEMGTSLPSHFN